MQITRAKFPDKFAPFWTPAPVKIVYGGRGKGASWSIARSLLTLGMQKKLFIVCSREVQKSIKDSVHKLLSDQIDKLGYGDFYEVLDVEIRCKLTGTTFVFHGLNNINSMKSLESADILWVTEANHVPKSKWVVLMPTFRRDPPYGPFKQGSEIWVDFNPELATDDTYQMFVVDPPQGAIVVHMSYRDNPWFPEILRRQMEEMRVKDYEEYLTTWEGRPRKTLSGAIYGNELGMAIQDGRVGPHVTHTRGRGIVATLDLGDSDMTAMWVWQQIGNDHYAIDYVEESGKDISFFIEWLLENKYIIKGLWLPHDADQQHQSARKLVHNTITKQARALLPTPGIVKVIPNVSESLQINAVRSLFPRVHINDIKCSRGVLCLQHYQYGVDQNTHQRTKKPLHNWASHGAKGFGYYAVWIKEGINLERKKDIRQDPTEMSARHSRFSGQGQHRWLGN